MDKMMYLKEVPVHGELTIFHLSLTILSPGIRKSDAIYAGAFLAPVMKPRGHPR